MFAKILVVDSSTKECLFIKNALSGYLVLTAGNSFEAMKRINENSDIDIIILDLDMPNKDGFMILNTLKSNEQYKKIHIIILTNSDESDNENMGLKMGANDYIRRPINTDSMKIRIDMNVELIKMKRLYEEKESERVITFDAIFNQAPIGITISHNSEPMSKEYDKFIVNEVFEKFTGRTKEELAQLGWANITHPVDLKKDMVNFKKLQSGEIKSYSMDKRYVKPDGSCAWGHMVVASFNLLNSNDNSHICFVQDISEQKSIEKALIESERSKSVLLSHLPGLAYRCNYDKQWTMQFVSDGCFDLTGYLPENLLYNKDLSFYDLIAPEYRESLWKEWESTLSNKLPFRYEYELITAKGERKWVLELGQGIFNEYGEVESLEGIVLDISDRKKIENNLKYNNEHDTWTGLYNRRYLDFVLMRDANTQTNEKRALVSINLNTMHYINMTYGFHYSQELIKRVADVLKMYCTDNIILFSTSEFRFVFYVVDYKIKNELVEFCEAVACTLESLLSIERIGGGIGILEIDDENKHDLDKIKKNLFISSERAINTDDREFSFCFYDVDMHKKIIREEEIKLELYHISTDETNSLFLQYQPILDLKTNKICGFEALSRISSDKLGFVSPLEFIPIAEKTKQIIQLGEKIIIHAFNFLNMLKKNGYYKIKVYINISAIQFQHKDFVKNLLKLVNEMHVDSRNIVIEITESLFVSNYNEINNIFNELRSFNIHIAIDDFGTGYSSLARERELNVDCIKIDKYFIDKLLLIDEKESISGDIISMFHKLGHCVIAEGVEHEKQKQYLVKHGCDKIQGYLISKPLNAEEAIKQMEL